MQRLPRHPLPGGPEGKREQEPKVNSSASQVLLSSCAAQAVHPFTACVCVCCVLLLLHGCRDREMMPLASASQTSIVVVDFPSLLALSALTLRRLAREGERIRGA